MYNSAFTLKNKIPFCFNLLFFMLPFFLLCSSGSCDKDNANTEMPSDQSDWLSQVRENIAKMEYEVSWQETSMIPQGKPGYHIANRAQDLRAYFYPDGITILKRSESAPLSRSIFRVGGISRWTFGSAHPLMSPLKSSSFISWEKSTSARSASHLRISTETR